MNPKAKLGSSLESDCPVCLQAKAFRAVRRRMKIAQQAARRKQVLINALKRLLSDELSESQQP